MASSACGASPAADAAHNAENEEEADDDYLHWDDDRQCYCNDLGVPICDVDYNLFPDVYGMNGDAAAEAADDHHIPDLLGGNAEVQEGAEGTTALTNAMLENARLQRTVHE